MKRSVDTAIPPRSEVPTIVTEEMGPIALSARWPATIFAAVRKTLKSSPRVDRSTSPFSRSARNVFPASSDVWYGPSEWPEVHIPNGTGVFGWLVDTLVTGRYRYTEHRFQEHDPLYAIGAFCSLGGASVESPDAAAATLLRAWKNDQAGLLARFDSNHDGIISGDEWDRARADARRQVLDGRAGTTLTPSLNVLARPADGRSFLLAASDGETLAQSFRRRALAGVGGFVGSSAALTWMLTRL